MLKERDGGCVEIFICLEKWHWWEDKDDARASLIQTELKTDNDTTTKAAGRGENDDTDTERGSSI